MKNTKQLVLGAMCATMVVILVFFNMISGGLFIFLIPFPLMYFGSKSDIKMTAVVYLTTVLLVTILAGMGYGLLTVGYGGVALGYCWARSRQLHRGLVYGVSVLVNGINFVVMALFASSIIGIEFTSDMATIGQWFGLEAGNLLLLLTLFAFLVLLIVETFAIIYVYEILETLVKRVTT